MGLGLALDTLLVEEGAAEMALEVDGGSERVEMGI